MVTLKPERLNAGEFNEQPLSICGKAFVADLSGALYWPNERALIVADLTLSRSVAGEAGDTLTKLAEAIDRTSAETIICLGSPKSAVALHADDLDTLRMLQDEREWIWLSGNLDGETAQALRGHVRAELSVAGLTLRDVPQAAPVTHEIAGHLRPAARISLSGHIIRRPCFVGNGRRLVLPAFGTVSGGRNVLDDAFAPLFANGGQSVWMLGQEGLYPVAPRLLRED